MKIINNNWQRQIVLEDNLIHTIVFENKKLFIFTNLLFGDIVLSVRKN